MEDRGFAREKDTSENQASCDPEQGCAVEPVRHWLLGLSSPDAPP